MSVIDFKESSLGFILLSRMMTFLLIILFLDGLKFAGKFNLGNF